jgi:hypothetical protein
VVKPVPRFGEVLREIEDHIEQWRCGLVSKKELVNLLTVDIINLGVVAYIEKEE